MTRPRVFILCGLPFAGKSTLARAMATRFRIAHVEVDQGHAERGVALSGRTLSQEDWRAAFMIAYRRLDGVLSAGKSAVWDATAYTRAHREKIRRVARRHGADASVIYVATPAAVADEWRLRNRATGERANVPDDDFTLVARGLEVPGPDEAPLIYEPTMPVERWLDETIAPLLDGRMQEDPR